TARPLKEVLKSLKLPQDSILVDMGCGKGKALLVASELDIKRAIGIELSKELCEIAERNVEAFRKRALVRADIRIIHSDVLNYVIGEDENVFFLFNPFDEVIIGRILDKLSLSLLAHPRKIW